MYWRWLLTPLIFADGCSRKTIPLGPLGPKIPPIQPFGVFDARTTWEKTAALYEMTRFSRNFLPTNFIIATSAAIQGPVPIPALIAASSMVHILTAISMVVNDIWDIEADRTNHPERPLVRGIVSRTEAASFSAVLSAAYLFIGFIGLKWKPSTAAIWILSFMTIHAYTPVLKRICLVKNLSCAAVVASTVPFIGRSASITGATSSNTFAHVFAHILFVGSMYKEILMDIKDRLGDKAAGIPTIPVLFGNRRTVQFLSRMMFSSFLYFSVFSRSHTYITLFYLPLYYRLWEVQKNDFQPDDIKRAIKTPVTVLAVIGVMFSIFAK